MSEYVDISRWRESTYLCPIMYQVTQIDHLSNWVMHNEDNTKCVCYLIT